jgi:hypothetical protein
MFNTINILSKGAITKVFSCLLDYAKEKLGVVNRESSLPVAESLFLTFSLRSR